MQKKIIIPFMITFFLMFVLINSVLAVESTLVIEPTQECVNNTHLEIIAKWTECNGNCTNKNVTQTINCTSGCDEKRDECLYQKHYESIDSGILLALSVTSGVFCIIGMKSDDKIVKILFMFIGLWLLVTTLGVADSIAISSGLSQPTIKAIETGITVVTRTVYVFMAYFMLTYLYDILMKLARSADALKRKRGRR